MQHVAAAERLLQDHRELALAEGHVLRALREALDDERELGEREVDLEALPQPESDVRGLLCAHLEMRGGRSSLDAASERCVRRFS